MVSLTMVKMINFVLEISYSNNHEGIYIQVQGSKINVQRTFSSNIREESDEVSGKWHSCEDPAGLAGQRFLTEPPSARRSKSMARRARPSPSAWLIM